MPPLRSGSHPAKMNPKVELGYHEGSTMLGNVVMQRVRAAITGKYWWFVLLIGVSVIQTAATVRALLRPRPLALDIDAALFQHAGWYITQGAIPYVHIWDPTPPLSFLVPALLSLLTRGEPLALHVLSMILTSMVAVTIALLIALLTLELTGIRYAAVIAGYVMFTNYPDLFSGLVFVALAVGIFAAQATPRVRHMLLVMLLCALILNPVIRHVTRPDRESSPDVTQIREVNGYRLPPLQIIYWNKIKPETCHYRLSHTELGWLELMEKRGTEEDCHGIP